MKVTMIGVPPLATDLIGPATQASSADMIVAAPRLHRLRAVRAGDRPDPLLEAGALDAALHVHPAGAYAGGDLPKWTYGIAQTLVNLPGPQSKLYLKKGLQYGATVHDMLWVFAEVAWEELLATVKIMNTIPYNKISPATISAGFKNFTRPARAGGRRRSPAARSPPGEPAVCGNQTQFYNYLGKGKWKAASGWLKPPGAK